MVGGGIIVAPVLVGLPVRLALVGHLAILADLAYRMQRIHIAAMLIPDEGIQSETRDEAFHQNAFVLGKQAVPDAVLQDRRELPARTDDKICSHCFSPL